MKHELKVGNVRDILSAILGVANAKIEEGYQGVKLVRVFTDTSEIGALHKKMQEEREKFLDARSRDNVLCRFQSHEYSLGAWKYNLATNIYGYAVGDTLKSNMGGGPFSCIHRGASLSEAMVFGCHEAKRKNVSFSFGLNFIPESLRETIVQIAGE